MIQSYLSLPVDGRRYLQMRFADVEDAAVACTELQTRLDSLTSAYLKFSAQFVHDDAENNSTVVGVPHTGTPAHNSGSKPLTHDGAAIKPQGSNAEEGHSHPQHYHRNADALRPATLEHLYNCAPTSRIFEQQFLTPFTDMPSSGPAEIDFVGLGQADRFHTALEKRHQRERAREGFRQRDRDLRQLQPNPPHQSKTSSALSPSPAERAILAPQSHEIRDSPPNHTVGPYLQIRARQFKRLIDGPITKMRATPQRPDSEWSVSPDKVTRSAELWSGGNAASAFTSSQGIGAGSPSSEAAWLNALGCAPESNVQDIEIWNDRLAHDEDLIATPFTSTSSASSFQSTSPSPAPLPVETRSRDPLGPFEPRNPKGYKDALRAEFKSWDTHAFPSRASLIPKITLLFFGMNVSLQSVTEALKSYPGVRFITLATSELIGSLVCCREITAPLKVHKYTSRRQFHEPGHCAILDPIVCRFCAQYV
jgi:hypothetical protein